MQNLPQLYWLFQCEISLSPVSTNCEIWVKIGDPAPTDGSQCQFLALGSATPYMVDYDGANGGKTAHYMLRCVTKGGEKLTWSETVSETIKA